MTIDHASHHFAFNKDKLRSLYIEQDRAVGELLGHVPDQTDIIIVSDHGHGAEGDWNFHTNNWLDRNEFLSRSDEVIDESRVFRKMGITRENAVRIKNFLGVNDIRSLLPQYLFDTLESLIPPEDATRSGFDPSAIDWGNTEAFSGMQNIIFINKGSASSDSAESLWDEIKTELETIEHPERDRKLVTYAHTKNELFEGPYYDSAPDIVFVLDEMRCKANITLTDSEVFTEQRWGEHRQYGVLATSGPSFDQRDEIDKYDIKDVFPLLCGLLGAPAPEDIDGSLPAELFQAAPELRTKENKTVDTSRHEYSDNEAEAVRSQLDDLGYLE
jgi:predicted AlkP superfamily phosphohydrolase/phosphomutase